MNITLETPKKENGACAIASNASVENAQVLEILVIDRNFGFFFFFNVYIARLDVALFDG